MARDTLRFGPFVFDPVALDLSRDSERVPIRPQVARVLVLLTEQAGESVTREAIRNHLWPEGFHLDHDTAINTCIRRLRNALDDRAAQPKYVLTLPGVGYRFIADVVRVQRPRRVPAAAPEPQSTSARERLEPSTSEAESREPPASTATRNIVLAAIAIAAVLLVGLGAWLAGGRHELHLPEGFDTGIEVRGEPDAMQASRYVLLQPLSNTEADTDLSRALGEAFRTGLEQSPQIQVMARRDIADTLRRMERPADTVVDRETAIEIAIRDGADTVVLLWTARVADTLLLEVEVIDPTTELTLGVERRRLQDDGEAIQALDELVASAVTALDVAAAPDGEVARKLEKVTTGSLEALKAYSLGRRQMMDGQLDPAFVLFEYALEQDPGLTMAHIHLAMYERRNRVHVAIRHLEAAQVHIDRLSTYERLAVEGWLAELRGDTKREQEAWTLLRELLPTREAGHYHTALGFAYDHADYESCLVAIERGLRRVRGTWATTAFHYARVHCLVGIERGSDAMQLLSTLPDKGIWSDERSTALLSAGQHAQLDARIEKWLEGGFYEEASLNAIRARSLASRGHFEGAFRQAGRAVELVEPAYESDLWIFLRLGLLIYADAADEQSRLQSETDALVDLIEARRDRDQEVAGRGLSTQVLALTGIMAARAGEVDTAQRLRDGIEPADSVTPGRWRAHRALLDAELLAARGDIENAVNTMQAALEEVDAFPLHAKARVATWLHALGRIEEGRTIDQWIVDHRGRAHVECLDGFPSCMERPFNVVALFGAAERHGVRIRTSDASRIR